MIAGAIANAPRLLIADEPTTALDATVQAQIIDLMRALRARDRDMALIFVTHNLALVRDIADRVAVMYAGEIVELGPAHEVFATPRHPYTAALLASMPEVAAAERLAVMPGAVPALGDLHAGCVFAPRCTLRQPSCDRERPQLATFAGGRSTRCIRWEALS